MPKNAPSGDYLERVNMLDNIVRDCISVSRDYAGIKSPTGRHFYASVLFTTLCTRGVSISMLVPHSPLYQINIQHWDYASIAVLARSILEIRLAFHYICYEEINNDEWECRWNILNLHDCRSRYLLFKDNPIATKDATYHKDMMEELRERLASNNYFLSLDKKMQADLLKGKQAYIHKLEDIAALVGFEKKTYRWAFRLFSAQVHGLPMAYYRMDSQERGRGVHSDIEEDYITICLSLVSLLMVQTRDEMHSIFKGLTPETPS